MDSPSHEEEPHEERYIPSWHSSSEASGPHERYAFLDFSRSVDMHRPLDEIYHCSPITNRFYRSLQESVPASLNMHLFFMPTFDNHTRLTKLSYLCNQIENSTQDQDLDILNKFQESTLEEAQALLLGAEEEVNIGESEASEFQNIASMAETALEVRQGGSQNSTSPTQEMPISSTRAFLTVVGSSALLWLMMTSAAYVVKKFEDNKVATRGNEYRASAVPGERSSGLAQQEHTSADRSDDSAETLIR